MDLTKYDYYNKLKIKVMKQKKLLIPIIGFLLLQFQTNVKAQEYIPMAVDGVHWIVKYDLINTPEPVDGLWEYYAEGDTIISNIIYTKIYKRLLVITQNEPPFEPDGLYELYGFIRDDTINNKVYAIQIYDSGFCPSNEEYLMFDFSVNVGDTVVFCLYPDFYDYIIVSINSGVFLGFDTRFFSNSWDYSYLEGMGSVFGLFEEMFIPVKSKNKRNLYSTSLYYYCRETPCDLLVTVPKIYSTSILNVFPNPTNNTLHFNINSPSIGDAIILMNMQGKQIKKIDIQSTTKDNVFSVTSLTPGLYVVLVLNKNSIIEKHKIIVVDQ